MMDWHLLWSVLAAAGGGSVAVAAFRRLLKLCAQSRWRYTIKYACALVGGIAGVLGGLDLWSDTAMLGVMAACWSVDMVSSAALWRSGAPAYTLAEQKKTPRLRDVQF